MKARGDSGPLLLVLAVAAICVAALIAVFHEPLLRSLALPVAYIAWALRATAVVVGQRIVWVAFVLVFAVLGLAALRAIRPDKQGAAASTRGEGSRTRASSWEAMLTLGQGSRSAQQVLVLEMRQLALSVLAHTDGGDPRDLQRRIVSGEIDVPACVRDLFALELEPVGGGKRRRTRPVLVQVPLAKIADALERRLGVADRDTESKR